MLSLLLISCVCLSVCHTSAQMEPLVLPPVVDQGTEVVLLITPGAYINYLMYEPLGSAIQSTAPYRLWVGLIGPFVNDLPNPPKTSTLIEETLSTMREMGMNSSYIFVSGHSLGGVCMQTWILENLEETSGMILLASEVSNEFQNSAEAVNLPVFHLSGDLDGLVIVSEVELIFRELEKKVAAGEAELVLTKPVVVLTDVNHMHFASGERPPAVEEHDILSPITEEEAHKKLSSRIESFMTVTISEEDGQHSQEAVDLLVSDYLDTKSILKALGEMHRLTLDLDQTSGLYFSSFAEMAQGVIGGIEDAQNIITVKDTNYETVAEFSNSRAKIAVSNDSVLVTTTSLITDYISTNLVEIVISAEELAVKMKSSEAIFAALAPFGPEFKNETHSCRDVNELAIELALFSASPIVRERFNSRGNGFTLFEDYATRTGTEFLNSKVIYNLTDEGLSVQSTNLATDLEAPLGLDGMFYCKLLPPDRALEHIMVDSLRRTDP